MCQYWTNWLVKGRRISSSNKFRCAVPEMVTTGRFWNTELQNAVCNQLSVLSTAHSNWLLEDRRSDNSTHLLVLELQR